MCYDEEEKELAEDGEKRRVEEWEETHEVDRCQVETLHFFKQSLLL